MKGVRPSPFDVMFYSASVRSFVEGVFADPDACHADRLDVARRILRDAGATVDEFCYLVENEANWADYDPVVTKIHALSVAQWLGRPVTSPEGGAAGLAKRSVPSFNPIESGWHVPTWAGSHNRAFFADAVGAAYQKAAEPSPLRARTMMFNPTWAFYRTVAGADHTLGVIDIDGTDLDRAWPDAKRVVEVAVPDLLKFSGRRGFHLIYRLDAGMYANQLKDWGRRLAGSAGLDVGHQKASAVDPVVWTPNALIRGYSVNLKSRLYSIAVDVTESLDSILERAARPEWEQPSGTSTAGRPSRRST